jgi:hypothetical protein
LALFRAHQVFGRDHHLCHFHHVLPVVVLSLHRLDDRDLPPHPLALDPALPVPYRERLVTGAGHHQAQRRGFEAPLL